MQSAVGGGRGGLFAIVMMLLLGFVMLFGAGSFGAGSSSQVNRSSAGGGSSQPSYWSAFADGGDPCESPVTSKQKVECRKLERQRKANAAKEFAKTWAERATKTAEQVSKTASAKLRETSDAHDFGNIARAYAARVPSRKLRIKDEF